MNLTSSSPARGVTKGLKLAEQKIQTPKEKTPLPCLLPSCWSRISEVSKVSGCFRGGSLKRVLYQALPPLSSGRG